MNIFGVLGLLLIVLSVVICGTAADEDDVVIRTKRQFGYPGFGGGFGGPGYWNPGYGGYGGPRGFGGFGGYGGYGGPFGGRHGGRGYGFFR